MPARLAADDARSTTRTDKPLRPTRRKHVGATRLLSPEPLLELSDLIAGRENRWATQFKPGRVGARGAAKSSLCATPHHYAELPSAPTTYARPTRPSRSCDPPTWLVTSVCGSAGLHPATHAESQVTGHPLTERPNHPAAPSPLVVHWWRACSRSPTRGTRDQRPALPRGGRHRRGTRCDRVKRRSVRPGGTGGLCGAPRRAHRGDPASQGVPRPLALATRGGPQVRRVAVELLFLDCVFGSWCSSSARSADSSFAASGVVRGVRGVASAIAAA